ncbi:MAG: GntR family transcriptional regulator [Enterocloster sp.]
MYPPGSYLPSAERLSAEKGVSVSTVRRAVCLLNSIGQSNPQGPLAPVC